MIDRWDSLLYSVRFSFRFQAVLNEVACIAGFIFFLLPGPGHERIELLGPKGDHGAPVFPPAKRLQAPSSIQYRSRVPMNSLCNA